METHHYIWLKKHPTRTADWLQEKLANGFHIHHIDNNHANNAPNNLCLIEEMDHHGIHLQHYDFKNTMREAIKRAKERGVRFGRPPKLSDPQKQMIRERYSAGKETLEEIARDYNVTAPTIWYVVNR